MKNGFTLIELLVVITILSLVALIASISVANMIKTSKDELSASQTKSIEIAAKAWGADNINLLPIGNSCSYILLKDLKDNGLLDSNILDPKDKKQISNNLKIKISSKLNSKGKSILTYEVNAKNMEECTYIGNPIYVDVPKGLTPVIYDGTNWKVPETNDEWYNYDKQMWANAVVLGKGKNKKPGETVKVDGTEALMMFVYIPRYEYKIQEPYGKDGLSANSPGEIEIEFINNSQTKADDGYILHPAFTFGGQNLSGIWVGKFELSSTNNSTTTSNLRTLPKVASLRNKTVSELFYAARSVENASFGLSNVDTHMIKNSEWGAVAYLSQSKYGKYGNTDYTLANRAIYQNKSSEYKTGSSNGTPSTGDSAIVPQCDYDNVTNKCGIGASTTGTIYGIYDMNGGAWEYVMGAYGTTYPIIVNSDFSTDPENVFESGTIESKYYDMYKSDNVNIACANNEVCYGHALSETLGWYGNHQHMVTSIYSWLLRGGASFEDASSGIFGFASYAGDDNEGLRSTRVVLLSE